MAPTNMSMGAARELKLGVRIEGDGSSLLSAVDRNRSALKGLRKRVGALSGALGTLAAGALAAAVSETREFNSALRELRKVSDRGTVRGVRPAIREMAETLPVAQAELAGVAAEAARFGIEGTENLTAFTESVSKMAFATTLSMDEAGQAFARLSKLTGTPVGQVENLGSAINSLSNNFATSSQEIVDSMLRSSAALSQLGLQQHEIAGLTAALNEVSASSRRAGTRLRRVAQELLAPGAAEEMAGALGLTVQQFRRLRRSNPAVLMQRLAETMAAGGEQADVLRESFSTASRQALAALGQNIDGLREALDLSNESFAEATSLTREFEIEADSFGAQLQLTQNRLRNVALATGGDLMPVLRDLLGGLNESLLMFSEWNERLDGLPGTIGLVTLAVGGLATSIFLLTGPIGLAIAGAGLLAGAFITNFAGIRDAAISTSTHIATSIGTSLDGTTAKTEQELGEQRAQWHLLGNAADQTFLRIITGLEVMWSIAMEKLDAIMTTLDKMLSKFRTVGGVAGAVLTGRFGDVRDVLQRGRERERDIQEQFRERKRGRRRRLRSLIQRKRERAGGPFSPVGRPIRSIDTEAAGPDPTQQTVEELREQQEESQRQFEAQMRRVRGGQAPVTAAATGPGAGAVGAAARVAERAGIAPSGGAPVTGPGPVVSAAGEVAGFRAGAAPSAAARRPLGSLVDGLGQHVGRFGRAVDRFATAVDQPHRVVVETAGEFGDAIEARVVRVVDREERAQQRHNDRRNIRIR